MAGIQLQKNHYDSEVMQDGGTLFRMKTSVLRYYDHG